MNDYKNKIDSSSCNAAIRTQIESHLTVPIIVYDAGSYPDHDRYWIIEDSEKAVHVGTSLNGLGLKLCSITVLTKTETRDLLKELSGITNTF